MTESDRYTDPKDAGWQAVEAVILLFGICPLAIGAMVWGAMG